MSNKENELAARVNTSRLLGLNKSLVLHGGGNTSVKILEKNILGEQEEILYVKGSGWDLETITAEGFSPVRLNHLKKLSTLPELSDSQMVNELITHLTKSSAPVPSVEAILHAVIPYKYVDHTHADSFISISNSIKGESIIRKLYGDTVVYIPYIMPGFDLSKLCASHLLTELTDDKIGILLLNHGLFSFGNTAEESYQRMLCLVKISEDYLHENVPDINTSGQKINDRDLSLEIAALRKDISATAGFPMIVKRVVDEKSLNFCNRPDIKSISQQGPATPDHVIRTKRIPLVGRDVHSFSEEYKDYFKENEPLAKERKKILDTAPRVVLDPQLSLCAVGRTVKDARIVADIYQHTIDIISSATALGGYRALPAKDIFDVEYWELEQAKLSKLGNAPEFTGEIALVTGAASGIGKACVLSLLKRGAAVIGLDINPAIKDVSKLDSFLGLTCDVTSELELKKSLVAAIDAFGGLDLLILNAGIFPPSSAIADLNSETWEHVMNINVDANFKLLKAAHPYLKLAPKGGRVVIIGSKNVSAPGPGAAAYSVSKAALNQLARVAALEWGSDNIRVNTVHPNAVFDTGIWSDDVLASRAKCYGLSLEAYKRNNVLKTDITSSDVSELAAELCGSLFSKTTGGQIAVDGGNDRVI
ncbi:MAG: bifunctional aldolase/short-chain dehydrogenase [Flavitalea sp.]